MSFERSAASPTQFPKDGRPEVAFLGRSNVGKSSLLNALAGTKGLARVAKRPGRTRTINFFLVDQDTYLVDLPGYGYAPVSDKLRRSWERLITTYLDRPVLALGVFLVDSRHDPTAGDLQLREYLDHAELPYVVAATKLDKLGRGRAAERLKGLSRQWGDRAQAVLGTSAHSGAGIGDLWKMIRAATAENREAAR